MCTYEHTYIGVKSNSELFHDWINFVFIVGGFEYIVETISKTISYKKIEKKTKIHNFFPIFLQFPINFLWGSFLTKDHKCDYFFKTT